MHQIQNFSGSTPVTVGAHCAPPHVLDGGDGTIFKSQNASNSNLFGPAGGSSHSPDILAGGDKARCPLPHQKTPHAFHPSGLSLSVPTFYSMVPPMTEY